MIPIPSIVINKISIKVMVSVSGIPQITSGKFQMKNKMEVIDTNNQYLVKLNHGINIIINAAKLICSK